MERGLASGILNMLLLAEVEREGPRHGYALVQDLEANVKGAFAFKEATVYALLKEAEEVGLVKSRWAPSDSGPPRKYYEITGRGRQALDAATLLLGRLRSATNPILHRKGVAA